jgi:hypothetical protein
MEVILLPDALAPTVPLSAQLSRSSRHQHRPLSLMRGPPLKLGPRLVHG